MWARRWEAKGRRYEEAALAGVSYRRYFVPVGPVDLSAGPRPAPAHPLLPAANPGQVHGYRGAGRALARLAVLAGRAPSPRRGKDQPGTCRLPIREVGPAA